MSFLVKIIIIIFVIAYFISPLDLIPDFLIPGVGWIDDTFLIGIALYLLRYGKLPFKNFSRLFNAHKKNTFYKNQAAQDTSNMNSDKSNTETNKDPYDVLGIKKNATKAQIQKAYKEKVKQYHPDKVSHLGVELQKMANEKFLEIKKAYDTLMK